MSQDEISLLKEEAPAKILCILVTFDTHQDCQLLLSVEVGLWVVEKGKVYCLRSPQCHFSHNHDLNPPQLNFDGRTEVKLKDDLTPTEAEFIKQQTLSHIPIPNL